jgi:8-oxo-dGTP diphosphatase
MTLTKAASVIVEHAGKVLFVRSTRTQRLWAYPGGKLEPGETELDAAKRETKEEVGIEITIVDDLGKYVIPYATGGFEIECFAGVAASSTLTLDGNEILEARWLSIEDGRLLDLTSTAREALEVFSARKSQTRNSR